MLELLIDVALRGALLLALAGVVSMLLRRTSASLRHLAWTVALAGVVALPLLTVVAPFQWRVLPAAWPAAPHTDPGPAAPADAATAASTAQPASTLLMSSATPGHPTTARAPEQPRQVASGTVLLLLLWGAGALLTTLAFLRAGLGLRALRRRAAPAPASWRALAGAAARRVGIQPPDLRVSAEVDIPIAVGPLGLAVLLPAEAREWPAERLATALQHEFAHVARHDLSTQLVAAAACVLHWFNPLVWLAARRARLEAERACDDVVVAGGALPSSYARHLLETALAAGPMTGSAPALSLARPSELEGRIRALLEPQRRGMPAGPLGGALVATAALALVLVVAAAAGSTATAETAVDAADAFADGRVSVLLDLVGDRDPDVRGAAARSLRNAPGAQAVPALLATLDDPYAGVREEAARALAGLRSPAAVPALTERAVMDERRDVRHMALYALGRIGTPEAVAGLAAALERTPRNETRERIAEALGESGSDAAVEPLRTLLGDHDRDVRHAALEALADLGTPASLAVLTEALATADSRTRRMLARALGENG